MSQQSIPEWAFRVSSTLEAELEGFKDVVELYKFGEISEAQFRATRVPMGIYEQRESGTYMLRAPHSWVSAPRTAALCADRLTVVGKGSHGRVLD